MAAVAFAVSYTGATPVFADVSKEDYNILPESAEKLINERTKAIIAVHTYGRLAPMKEIMKLANDYGIYVIEDACEAQGAVYKSKADISCWSFYKNKIIASEEGGMITTNVKDFADEAKYLKNMAFDESHSYFHEDIGYNYRMSNAHALIALESLKKYEDNSARRREIETLYNTLLGRDEVRAAVWFYDYKTTPEKIEKIIKNIPNTRMAFKPLSSFPMYGGFLGRRNALELSRETVLLPADPNFTNQDITFICNFISSL